MGTEYTASQSTKAVKVLIRASLVACPSKKLKIKTLPSIFFFSSPTSNLPALEVAAVMSLQVDFQKPKRFKQALTLAQKINILDCLRDGMGATAVGRMYGINESSVRFIRKNEDKIRLSMNGMNVAASADQPHYLPVSRNSTLVKAEEELSAWMADMAEQKAPISAKDIRERAKEIYHSIRENSPNPFLIADFVASKSWYSRFMRRSCHFPIMMNEAVQPGESPNGYYDEAVYPNVSYEMMSPSTSAYETMSPSDMGDINGNINSEYMQEPSSDPEVILLDCDDEENEDTKSAMTLTESQLEVSELVKKI